MLLLLLLRWWLLLLLLILARLSLTLGNLIDWWLQHLRRGRRHRQRGQDFFCKERKERNGLLTPSSPDRRHPLHSPLPPRPGAFSLLATFFGFLFRVCTPSFFMAIGRGVCGSRGERERETAIG